MKSRILHTGILATLGLAVSLYLLTVHWGWWSAVCLGVGDCEVVNTSVYSELLGIPVALLGALTYISIIAATVLRYRKFLDELALRAQFFLAVVGVTFSAYLTFIEVSVIKTICPWCVLSAILITVIAGLSIQESIAA